MDRRNKHLSFELQCNSDIRDPDRREILSGPKLEPVLPKQNSPNQKENFAY